MRISMHLRSLTVLVLFGVCTLSLGDIISNEYDMPDGTRIKFGTVTNFSSDGLRDIVDLQLDEFIPGNLLAVGSSSLFTVNETDTSIVLGHPNRNDYRNGAGTEARVSYPTICQLTPEILLLGEYYNHCVRKLNRTDNNTVSDFVGSCKNPGYADGVGTASKFTKVVRLLQDLDDPNLVYVAEDGGNVRLIEVDTMNVTTFLYNAFTSLTSILWDPYYCNVMLITNSFSFNQLNLTSMELTVFGNSSGYVDGSLHEAQYTSLFDAQVIYKDLYIAADWTDHRLRVIDTATCFASTICNGTATIAEGSLTLCEIDLPSSLLYTDGVLYIGGKGYIMTLPIEVELQGSPPPTVAPGCSSVAKNGSIPFTYIEPCILSSTTTSTTNTATSPPKSTDPEVTTTPLIHSSQAVTARNGVTLAIALGVTGGLILLGAIIAIAICCRPKRAVSSEGE